MTPPRTNNEVLAVLEERMARVEQGQAKFDQSLERIENLLTQMTEYRSAQSEVIAVMRSEFMASQAATDRRVTMLETSNNALRKELTEYQQKLGPLIWTNALLGVVGSVVLVSIVGLVWGLLTGQFVLIPVP